MTVSFIVCDVLGTVVRDGKQTFNCPLADNIHLRTVDGQEFNIHVPSGQLFSLTSRSTNLDELDTAEFIKMVCGQCVNAIGCVIAALATRNTLKITSTNTRIGTSKRIKPKYLGPQGAIYRSITTLDVPRRSFWNQIRPSGAGRCLAATASAKRSHSYFCDRRRPHWTQTTMAGAGLVKADPAFAAKARAYVVK